jgi:hypothetical protein
LDEVVEVYTFGVLERRDELAEVFGEFTHEAVVDDDYYQKDRSS